MHICAGRDPALQAKTSPLGLLACPSNLASSSAAFVPLCVQGEARPPRWRALRHGPRRVSLQLSSGPRTIDLPKL